MPNDVAIDLAARLLATAGEEYREKPSGAEVWVTLPEENRHVSSLELVEWIIKLAPTYSFQAGPQQGNQQALTIL